MHPHYTKHNSYKINRFLLPTVNCCLWWAFLLEFKCKSCTVHNYKYQIFRYLVQLSTHRWLVCIPNYQHAFQAHFLHIHVHTPVLSFLSMSPSFFSASSLPTLPCWCKDPREGDALCGRGLFIGWVWSSTPFRALLEDARGERRHSDWVFMSSDLMGFFVGDVTGNSGFLMAGSCFLRDVSLSHDFDFVSILEYVGGDELVMDTHFTKGLVPLAFRGEVEVLMLPGLLGLDDWLFFITSAWGGVCLRSLRNLGMNCFLVFTWSPEKLEKSISQAVLLPKPSLTALLGSGVWSREGAEIELSSILSLSPQSTVNARLDMSIYRLGIQLAALTGKPFSPQLFRWDINSVRHWMKSH